MCGDACGTALELLVERYDKQYLLINAHLKALFDLPSANNNNAVSFRNLVNEIKQHL